MSPPLRWSGLTGPQRLILCVFPVICLLLGSDFWIAGPQEIAHSPTLRVANDVLPIRWWGLSYLLCGLAMVWSLVTGVGYWIGLAAMVGILALWSIIFAVASFVDVASSSVWIWPGGLAAVGWGCLRGLATRDKE